MLILIADIFALSMMLHKDQRIFLTPEGLPPNRTQIDPPWREVPPVIIRSRIIEGFGLALKREIINATEITPFFRCFQPLSARHVAARPCLAREPIDQRHLWHVSLVLNQPTFRSQDFRKDIYLGLHCDHQSRRSSPCECVAGSGSRHPCR